MANVTEKKPVIIIADDVDAYLDNLALMLMPFRKDYEIVKAEFLDEALEKYADLKGRVRLIITDNDMAAPGEGVQLIKTLRKNNDNVPILLNSGDLTREQYETQCADCVHSANTRFLKKPLAKAEFLSEVKGLLAISKGPVLVVDGNDDIRERLAESLRKNGYTVAAVRDSQEALALFDRNPAAYSSVVTEGSAGIDFINGIRKRGSDAPALFVNGDGENMAALTERIKLLPGNNGVLAREYDPAQLVNAMAKLRSENMGTPGVL